MNLGSTLRGEKKRPSYGGQSLFKVEDLGSFLLDLGVTDARVQPVANGFGRADNIGQVGFGDVGIVPRIGEEGARQRQQALIHLNDERSV